MSLKTFIVKAEETALAALKEAGTIIEHFVISEEQALVAKVKASDLGTTAMNLISAFTSHAGSGEEKMSMLIGAVMPALKKVEAVGGLEGLKTSVEDFAREFGQSAYNDFVNVAKPLVLHAADELHSH